MYIETKKKEESNLKPSSGAIIYEGIRSSLSFSLERDTQSCQGAPLLAVNEEIQNPSSD